MRLTAEERQKIRSIAEDPRYCNLADNIRGYILALLSDLEAAEGVVVAARANMELAGCDCDLCTALRVALEQYDGRGNGE